MLQKSSGSGQNKRGRYMIASGVSTVHIKLKATSLQLSFAQLPPSNMDDKTFLLRFSVNIKLYSIIFNVLINYIIVSFIFIFMFYKRGTTEKTRLL